MLGSIPTTTIVFEDSVIGRQAAEQSGAFLVEVERRTDLTIPFVQRMIEGYLE
jgi:beta-phosphoglucomutase-like phosphatase (HAD superfamily)